MFALRLCLNNQRITFIIYTLLSFLCHTFFSGLQPTFRLRLPRSFSVAAMCSWRQRLEAGRPARSAFRSFKLCTNRGGMLPLGQQLEKVGGSKRQRKLNVRAIANAGPDCSVTPSCNLRSAACARPILSWMVQLNPSGVNMRLHRAIGFTFHVRVSSFPNPVPSSFWSLSS